MGLSAYVEGRISTYAGGIYSYQTPSSDAEREPAWPAGEPSAYGPDVACYEPGQAHECFSDEKVMYIAGTGASQWPGRTYLPRRPGESAYLAVDKVTGSTRAVVDTTGLTQANYLEPCYVYGMDVLLHGQDHPAERYPAAGQQPWRTMAWKTQIDYDCDTYNWLRDGGGSDDIEVVNWGEDGDDLTIDSAGLWKKHVRVHVPSDLVNEGIGNYRLLIWLRHLYPEGGGSVNDPRVEELYGAFTAQLGQGRIRAVALDQTRCNTQPLRPGYYHTFRDLRPPLATPPTGTTWRSCSGLPPSEIDSSLSLSMMAMSSNDDAPVEKFFRIIFQDATGEELECTGDGF